MTKDQSIASTKTKYIKLNTKPQNIFCCVNESSTIFYTLSIEWDKKTEGDNFFCFFKVYNKVKILLTNKPDLWF